MAQDWRCGGRSVHQAHGAQAAGGRKSVGSSRGPGCAVESGVTRTELRIVNRGYLGSVGLPSAKGVPHAEPLRLSFDAGPGVSVLAPTQQVVEIGQLDGWGGGLYGGPSVFSPWTRGNGHERFVTLVTQGQGKLSVKVGSCRVGYRGVDVDVG
jgi:hypothetical protein